MMALFNYVGPESIRLAARGAPGGTRLDSPAALLDWLRHHQDGDGGWATYVISADGDLPIAPRRSEHVACAGGGPVRAAGEIRFGLRGDVVEVTNNSTGFCPAESCWPAVRSALESAGLRYPGELTFVAVFRRCLWRSGASTRRPTALLASGLRVSRAWALGNFVNER